MAVGHVACGAVRHVAVRPERVLARRGPRRVGDGRLHAQHVRAAPDADRRQRLARPPRSPAASRRGARSRPARRAGRATGRAVERPVELEHARPVPEPAQPPPVAGRQPIAGDGEHLPRGEVEQHAAGGRQFGQVADRGAGVDLPAELAQRGSQRDRQILGATLDDRPADLVRERGHERAVSRRGQLPQTQHRMAGHPGEHRPRLGGAKRRPRQHFGRQDPRRPVANQCRCRADRPPRRQRRQQRVDEPLTAGGHPRPARATPARRGPARRPSGRDRGTPGRRRRPTGARPAPEGATTRRRAPPDPAPGTRARPGRAAGRSPRHRARKPGRVRCSLRNAPPTRSAASTTSTRRPCLASVSAATRPFGPAPTTTASNPSAALTSSTRQRRGGRGEAAHPRSAAPGCWPERWCRRRVSTRR